MAIDTINKRAASINIVAGFGGPFPRPDNDINNGPDRRHIAGNYPGIASVGAANTIHLFDVRVMNIAVTETGGEAVDSANLGAISYVFDDMKNNEGDVTLPYG